MGVSAFWFSHQCHLNHEEFKKCIVLSIFEWLLKTGFIVSGCTLTIRRSIRMFIFLKGSKHCTRAGTHSLLKLRSKDCEVIWVNEVLNIMAN